MSGVRSFLARINRPSPTVGTTDARVDPPAVAAGLAQLGPAGANAAALDAWVEEHLRSFTALSELTSQLALAYLDRIRHPLVSLGLETGVTLTTRGYLAHLGVEADPLAFGASTEIPVIGTLPDLRRGRPPQDLLSRVVKASRRHFDAIRAVPDDVWSGFVLCSIGRTHEAMAAGTGEDESRAIDRTVVDGLLRFGWVLRQVDLRYGLSPGSEPDTAS